jgi:hypothetical protein
MESTSIHYQTASINDGFLTVGQIFHDMPQLGIIRPEFQKRSALKLDGRIIPIAQRVGTSATA